MDDYKKVFEKLKKQYSAEEIAEGYLIPEELSAEELEESNKTLLQVKRERLAERTEQRRLIARFVYLRKKIKKYLKNDLFLTDYSFGKILNEYIKILGKSQKAFAIDIDLHPSKLNRILREKEEPNVSLVYRLEKHSGEIISAVLWWKLMIRKQAHLIEEEVMQRKIEGERVQSPLKFSA